MIGFEVHSSRKWQAARAVFASIFAFVAVMAMIFTAEKPEQIFTEQPALLFAAFLFLVFSLVLTAQLYHVLTTRFVLEFTDDAIFDRRRRLVRVIPFSSIEIFSPSPEEIFSLEASLAEARARLGMEEYISINCRLSSDEDFIFFEMVQTPPFEMQKQIIARLRNKISRFEFLDQDDGSGFGDDETNA
jgi:hypothetical protein